MRCAQMTLTVAVEASKILSLHGISVIWCDWAYIRVAPTCVCLLGNTKSFYQVKGCVVMWMANLYWYTQSHGGAWACTSCLLCWTVAMRAAAVQARLFAVPIHQQLKLCCCYHPASEVIMPVHARHEMRGVGQLMTDHFQTDAHLRTAVCCTELLMDWNCQ